MDMDATMNLNDLIKAIPKEFHDRIIKIYIPEDMDDTDRGKYYPLIQVAIDDFKNEISILLDADTQQ